MEKVIIDQESLKRFINRISPGAYVSLTKIDFRALDSANAEPIGVYGSKERIVDLLLEVEAIEPQLCVVHCTSNIILVHRLQPCSVNLLLASKSNSTMPHLRSGIYFLQPQSPSNDDPRLFVIYWPEETTWDDDAVTSVKRNRVTFMRYHRVPLHGRFLLSELSQVPDKDCRSTILPYLFRPCILNSLDRWCPGGAGSWWWWWWWWSSGPLLHIWSYKNKWTGGKCYLSTRHYGEKIIVCISWCWS